MQLIETTNYAEYREAGGDPRSSDNQRILDDLVHRDVHLSCGMLIDFFLKNPAAARSAEIDEDELFGICSKTDYREGAEEWIRDAAAQDLFDAALITSQDGFEDGADEPDDFGLAALRQIADRNLTAMQERDISEICDDQHIDPDPVEALEHWVVDRWFASRLQDEGEMVSNECTPDGWWVWGRRTSGQAISMDHVVIAIAAKMQILQGQKFSWRDK